MRAMSALALRHEDSINTLQADLSFIVYLDTPGKTAASAIPALVQTQREHKQTSEGIPLRQKLLLALFSQLESQIQKVVADKDLIQAGVHDGLLKQEGSSGVHFVYQMWDATAAKQVPNDSIKPIPTKEILQTLREIASLAGTPGSISRFQISRSLTVDMAGGPVRVQIQLGQFATTDLRDRLQSLVGNTVWLLIGANFRKGDIKRSPLAMQIERLSKREASSSA